MSDDDQQLLALAAKAAGVVAKWNDFFGCYTTTWHGPGGQTLPQRWNPLTDDGDALRRAVALRMDIEFAPQATWLGTKINAPVPMTMELHSNDAMAATRRAIVRAAAEIGRAMS